MAKALVTGGAGFIGACLVKRLVRDGWDVTVVDALIRGAVSRLAEVADAVTVAVADVRDEEALSEACRGAEVVFHLAAVNGTENFYTRPELVLDVGLRGALAVVNACRKAGVPDLVVASSAEVYQTPASVPTPEDVPLMLPDSQNPRYSYGGSKIISELIAFNYGREHFRKLQIFRPHNIYGPDMGWKHVVPQFILRAAEALEASGGAAAPFPIEGDGSETRAFCYVEDAVDGIVAMYRRGRHREIYHIGNDEEISIRDLAAKIGGLLGGELRVKPGAPAAGGTPRRCPDISKMRALGYAPRVSLAAGLEKTAHWYLANRTTGRRNDLM